MPCAHMQPVAWALAAAVGSLVVVAVVVVRIFLGWQYVGDRLMSAVRHYGGGAPVAVPQRITAKGCAARQVKCLPTHVRVKAHRRRLTVCACVCVSMGSSRGTHD